MCCFLILRTLAVIMQFNRPVTRIMHNLYCTQPFNKLTVDIISNSAPPIIKTHTLLSYRFRYWPFSEVKRFSFGFSFGYDTHRFVI